MRELSLFTGAGGSIWAGKLLGWSTIGYVENNDYCQRVIRQRIRDGIFDDAPIFGDIRAFIGEGYADSYKGVVDVVTAGFPCTPFSLMGKRLGEADPRNMWPETIECIRRIRPKYALLENSPGITTDPYFGRILGDLAEALYDLKADRISAGELGAPQTRKRIWIVCSDATRIGRHQGDTNTGGGNEGTREAQKRPGFTDISWWAAEPDVPRVVTGMANRSHRSTALGNGWVPIVAATAFLELSGLGG